MDLLSLSLAALVALGAVNVVTMFKPDLESKYKFVLSIAVAFAVGFVPADLGSILLNHLRDALAAATAISGVYKLTQKMGGA